MKVNDNTYVCSFCGFQEQSDCIQCNVSGAHDGEVVYSGRYRGEGLKDSHIPQRVNSGHEKSAQSE